MFELICTAHVVWRHALQPSKASAETMYCAAPFDTLTLLMMFHLFISCSSFTLNTSNWFGSEKIIWSSSRKCSVCIQSNITTPIWPGAKWGWSVGEKPNSEHLQVSNVMRAFFSCRHHSHTEPVMHYKWLLGLLLGLGVYSTRKCWVHPGTKKDHNGAV